MKKLRDLGYVAVPTKELARRLLIELHKKNLISDNALKLSIHEYSTHQNIFDISGQRFIYSDSYIASCCSTYYGEEFKEINFITDFKKIYSQRFGLIEFSSYNEFINYINAMHEWIDILYVSSLGFREEDIYNLKLNIRLEYIKIHNTIEETFIKYINKEMI